MTRSEEGGNQGWQSQAHTCRQVLVSIWNFIYAYTQINRNQAMITVCELRTIIKRCSRSKVVIESTSTRCDRWWVGGSTSMHFQITLGPLGWCLTTAGFPARHRSELGNGCIVRKFPYRNWERKFPPPRGMCHTLTHERWLRLASAIGSALACLCTKTRTTIHGQFSMLFVAGVDVGVICTECL